MVQFVGKRDECQLILTPTSKIKRLCFNNFCFLLICIYQFLFLRRSFLNFRWGIFTFQRSFLLFCFFDIAISFLFSFFCMPVSIFLLCFAIAIYFRLNRFVICCGGLRFRDWFFLHLLLFDWFSDRFFDSVGHFDVVL